MTQIQRGMRDKLSKYIDINKPFKVSMRIEGKAEYDYCCFAVDAADKLSDDRYMMFYNQTVSPDGEMKYAAVSGGADFEINLLRLPTSINKLVFTASIDGEGTMGEILEHTFSISQDGAEVLKMQLSGADFHSEKAVISVEMYIKDEWRFRAVAAGFDGGLADLLAHYGGEAESSTSEQEFIPPEEPAPLEEPVPPVQEIPPEPQEAFIPPREVAPQEPPTPPEEIAQVMGEVSEMLVQAIEELPVTEQTPVFPEESFPTKHDMNPMASPEVQPVDSLKASITGTYGIPNGAVGEIPSLSDNTGNVDFSRIYSQSVQPL